MCLLFESIRIEDRKLCNISFHNERLNRSRKALFGRTDFIHLEEEITIPENLSLSTYKCRVIYKEKIKSVEFEAYQIKSIQSLKIVETENLDYHFKYLNRDSINHLFQKKGDCDDILIVKDGLITDASYANVVLFDGKNWLTPKIPLLKGTMREKLIVAKMIAEADITISSIRKYKVIKLINAMMPFELAQEITTDRVY